MHPVEDLGTRRIEVGDKVYISSSDASGLEDGGLVRLKDLCNIKVTGMEGGKIRSDIIEEDIDIRSLKKIQWASEDSVPVSVLMSHPLYKDKELNPDSLSTHLGLGEASLSSLDIGEVVQFERYGFVRVDSKDNGGIGVVFSHK